MSLIYFNSFIDIHTSLDETKHNCVGYKKMHDETERRRHSSYICNYWLKVTEMLAILYLSNVKKD